MAGNRDIRKLINTKQDVTEFNGTPSVGGMSDGQIAIAKSNNKQLAIYRKKYGKLWKSYMSYDGNEYVDKRLMAEELKFTRRFTDYKVFTHNFTDDLGTTEHYVPWNSNLEAVTITSTGTDTTGFLAPYKMTLHRLFFRIDTVSQQADLTFKVKRVDSGDTTTDDVATFEYTATISADTTMEVKRGNFDNTPVISAGNLIGISITPDADYNQAGVSNAHFITSVWETEILI